MREESPTALKVQRQFEMQSNSDKKEPSVNSLLVHQKKLLQMKTNKNIIKDFKAVKFMREVRDSISNDIKDMTFEEIKKYFEERRKIKLSAK
ncbi:MAG: hypothetical protein ABIN67_24410 [Ferruginibacter sp.]